MLTSLLYTVCHYIPSIFIWSTLNQLISVHWNSLGNQFETGTSLKDLLEDFLCEKCICFHIQCLYRCCSNSASFFFLPTALWDSLLSFFVRCLSFLPSASLLGNFHSLLQICYAFLFVFSSPLTVSFHINSKQLLLSSRHSSPGSLSMRFKVIPDVPLEIGGYTLKIIFWKLVVFLFLSLTWNLCMGLWAVLQSASGHVFDAITEVLHLP